MSLSEFSVGRLFAHENSDEAQKELLRRCRQSDFERKQIVPQIARFGRGSKPLLGTHDYDLSIAVLLWLHEFEAVAEIVQCRVKSDVRYYGNPIRRFQLFARDERHTLRCIACLATLAQSARSHESQGHALALLHEMNSSGRFSGAAAEALKKVLSFS